MPFRLLNFRLFLSAMKKSALLFLFIFLYSMQSRAQMEEYVQEAEFGFNIGIGHYFGDLNNRMAVNRPKIALGAFFRKQFSNYAAARLSVNYAMLGYSDKYSDNTFQQRRNLSFNTNVFELALQGDFNFFKFIPSDPYHCFTPYASLGVGVFSYNPYAFYQGEKAYLRPLHTEGQTFYKGRKEYGNFAVSFPIGFGFKYAVTDKINLSFELTHRLTTTDYIDDVSTTYVGADKFPPASGSKSLAGILQDRSFETGTPIGIEGRQRGFSKQKDQFATATIGISINITSYRCPQAKL